MSCEFSNDCKKTMIGILVVTVWNLVSFFPEFFTLYFLYKKTPALAEPKEPVSPSEPKSSSKGNPITVWVSCAIVYELPTHYYSVPRLENLL